MKRYASVRQSGFTLLELMVVIVILGILAVFIAPKFMDAPDKAKISKASVELESLATALKLFKLDMGRYPTTEEGLEILVTPPQNTEEAARWRKGGYLEKPSLPMDPWGHPYVYIFPGSRGDFELLCYGADGQAAGEDVNSDIDYWDIK
ncbi:MAG: type II secretion system major pseudopilin GspG [Thermodesulfobacteriota bacterium]